MANENLPETIGQVRELLKATIEKVAAAASKADEAGGREKPVFFPDGVKDIFAKVTVGPITVEVEVSEASVIHGAVDSQEVVKASLGPQAFIRPMWADVSKQDEWLTTKDGKTVHLHRGRNHVGLDPRDPPAP